MIVIKNGKIVTKDQIIENKFLVIDGEFIKNITDEMPDHPDKIINAYGRYVMPGFIDIHSDKIEQFILPRPTAQFDLELSLKECEKELLNNGITTIFHSISLYNDDKFGTSPLKTYDSVKKLAELIRDIHKRDHLIHHRFHLRIEIDNIKAYDIAVKMIEEGLVHEISFMDHSPGQGQYKDMKMYKESLRKDCDMIKEDYDFQRFVEQERNKERLSFEQLKKLTEIAHEHGISVASHDDDTIEKLILNEKIGVDISEFPITIEAAKEAKQLGFVTIVGAPNILRGGSHSGNMSAADAIMNDCADVICTDYYPPALLHGIFIMNKKYNIGIPEMVKKVSLNPAKAVGLGESYGSIEIGKKADIVIVDILDQYPVITHVLVDGRTTSRLEYRR